MDRTYYESFLHPLQDRVLRHVAAVETGFYLSGGTAIARGYLNHRYSDDLDLFVNDDPHFRLWAERIIQGLAREAAWRVEVVLRDERFFRLNVIPPEGSLKIELIDDVPAHVGTLRDHPVLGRLDSPENILANKLTALVDRREPKDFADVWGLCCVMGLPLDAALAGAQSKAAGIFPPDLARVLLSADLDDWKLVRWVEPPAVESFVGGLHRLGEELLLLT